MCYSVLVVRLPGRRVKVADNYSDFWKSRSVKTKHARTDTGEHIGNLPLPEVAGLFVYPP